VRQFDKFFTEPDKYVPDGGESLEELLVRTDEFLREIYRTYEGQDENILVTTHGAALNAMLCSIKGNDDVAKFWSGKVHPNCGVTVVQVEGGKPLVLEEAVVYYKDAVRNWKWEER